MTTFSIETTLEQFTEADLENLELMPEELESLEAESIENMTLEDVEAESVAESLEGFMETNPPVRPILYTSTNSSSVNKQLLKTFTNLVKQVAKKAMSNPKTRAKMQAAVRKGPTAVAQLLTPIVAQQLPGYFRWMAAIYVPPVTSALFEPIRKQVGVKPEQVQESLEWNGFGNF